MSSKFEELFDELSKTNDRSIIWNNWLDYCININLMQKSSQYAPNSFYGNEETYFEMFSEWINELNSKLKENSYYDMLGHLYEDNVQSKGKQKNLQQYYTPPGVTELMSALTTSKNSSYDDYCFANDPCCGSGRLLLAAHCNSKGNLYCIGNDLDETSVKMCVLNFYSHGVRGSVLHMNTLEGTFYKGWRVNRWLLHGIPLPHIEEINSINEAYNFIGLNKNKPKENTLVKDKVDESINEHGNKIMGGQTTLI